VAKAAPWVAPDAERRKPGERTGLETLVVLGGTMDASVGPERVPVARKGETPD